MLLLGWAKRGGISFSSISPGTEAAARHLAGGRPDQAGFKQCPPRTRSRGLNAFFCLPYCSLQHSSLVALGKKWWVCSLCELLGPWVLPPHLWLTGGVFFNLLLIQSCAEERIHVSMYHLLHRPTLSYQAIWIKTWLRATVKDLWSCSGWEGGD